MKRTRNGKFASKYKRYTHITYMNFWIKAIGYLKQNNKNVFVGFLAYVEENYMTTGPQRVGRNTGIILL